MRDDSVKDIVEEARGRLEDLTRDRAKYTTMIKALIVQVCVCGLWGRGCDVYVCVDWRVSGVYWWSVDWYVKCVNVCVWAGGCSKI